MTGITTIGLCGWNFLCSFGRVSFPNFNFSYHQENHSGYPTRFASPYIMRLLKRGGVDYEVRLMKRGGGGLAVVEMVKRGENEEEAGRDYGIPTGNQLKGLSSPRGFDEHAPAAV